MKHNILTLFTTLISLHIVAQSALFNLPIESYNAHLNYSQVAQNDQDILPFKDLENIQLYLYSDNIPQGKLLKEYLERYLPTLQINDLSNNKIKTSSNNNLSKTIILLLNDINKTKAQIDSINTLLEAFNVVSILLDLNLYETIPNIVESNAIVHLFNNDDASFDILSQQLFGGTAISKSIMMDSDKNEINTETESIAGRKRLGFAPAELVGMDDNKMNAQIDSIAIEGIMAGAYPGCQVLVARHGKVVFHKAYGYHTYSNEQKVTETDVYDLASITKIAAATNALMKLNGEGKFDLDAPLKTYFPNFENSNKALLPMRQILAHNARLQSWIAYYTFAKKTNGKFKGKTLKNKNKKKYAIKLTDNLFLYNDYKEKTIYKMIEESPLNDSPGYVYSGLSFYLYPEIIENLSGKSFEDFLKKEIYQKLGANSITFNPKRYFPLEKIIPTEKDTFFRMIQLHGVVHDEGAAMMDGVSGNAGLFSNTLDLAKVLQMWLNKGNYGGEQILKSEVIEEFTKCQYCDEGNRRGLGFERPLIEYDAEKSHVAKSVSQSSFGHSGYTGTFVWVDPEFDLIYVFMSNRVYPTRLNRKLYTMNIRPRIQQAIYDSIME